MLVPSGNKVEVGAGALVGGGVKPAETLETRELRLIGPTKEAVMGVKIEVGAKEEDVDVTGGGGGVELELEAGEVEVGGIEELEERRGEDDDGIAEVEEIDDV